MVLVATIEVSVSSLTSSRSTQAQRSNIADPGPHSKQEAPERLQPPCSVSPIILFLRKIQGELPMTHMHTVTASPMFIKFTVGLLD